MPIPLGMENNGMPPTSTSFGTVPPPVLGLSNPQSRPDRVISGSHSELMVEVHAKGYRPGPDQGALSLVAACAGTGGHNRVDGRSIRLVGDGTVRFSVEPGLGTHNRRKLVGCLEDATIDRLRGDVVSIETIAP